MAIVLIVGGLALAVIALAVVEQPVLFSAALTAGVLVAAAGLYPFVRRLLIWSERS